MSAMSKTIKAAGVRVSGLYFQGENVEVKVPVVGVVTVYEAKAKVKTRTRNFVKHLKTVFADRFEFFIECQGEGYDVVTVGDKAKFKNFEIHVDYNMNQIRVHNTVVMKSMEELEAYLGKVKRKAKNKPTWANDKALKVKKQIEKLMTKTHLNSTKMKDNEIRSKVMSFSF